MHNTREENNFLLNMIMLEKRKKNFYFFNSLLFFCTCMYSTHTRFKTHCKYFFKDINKNKNKNDT